MSEEQETSAATPAKVVRTTRQFEIGDGLHVVEFRRTKETTILRDEPGRTFANLPTMSIEESEAIVRQMTGLPDDFREEVLWRLAMMKKRKRIDGWRIGREQLRELIDQFGDNTAEKIVYHAVRYFNAANIGAALPHMDDPNADKMLQRLIVSQYTESEVK